MELAEVFFIYEVYILKLGWETSPCLLLQVWGFYSDFVLKALYKLYGQYFSAMKATARREQSFYSPRKFSGEIWRQKVSTRVGTSLGHCEEGCSRKCACAQQVFQKLVPDLEKEYKLWICYHFLKMCCEMLCSCCCILEPYDYRSQCCFFHTLPAYGFFPAHMLIRWFNRIKFHTSQLHLDIPTAYISAEVVFS